MKDILKDIWAFIQMFGIAVILLSGIAFLVLLDFWFFRINHPGAPWWGVFLRH
jgi:hypothetical protein